MSMRTSDPLGTYAQDPRGGLRNSGIGTGPVITNKSSSKLCFAVLLILLIGFGVVVLYLTKYHQKEKTVYTELEDRTTICNECIEYDRIARVSTDAEGVENYIQSKLDYLTKISFSQNFNKSIVAYDEKLGNVHELKEKVNTLGSLKENLGKLVSDALKIESRLKQYQESYGTRVETIETLGARSIIKVREVSILNVNISEWQKELEKVNKEIDAKDEALQEKREEFYNRLTDINKQVEERLEGGRLNEDEIDRILKEKDSKIRDIDRSKVTCESDIGVRELRISELRARNHSLSDQLFEVEYKFKQRRLEMHSLETANKLQEVINQLGSLQKSSSQKAKVWLNEVIESLRTKQNEYNEVANRSHRNSDTQKVLDSLREAIENEKTLLKNWGQEQFNTLKLSIEEIGSVKAYLRHLNKTLEGDREELEGLIQKKKDLLEELAEIPRLIAEQLAEIEKCKKILRESGEIIKRETEEVMKMKQKKETIIKLREEMKQYKNTFDNKEKEAVDYWSGLAKEKDFIVHKITQARSEISRSEQEIRQYSREINKILEQGPRSEDVRKESEAYQQKIAQADETYKKITEVLGDIKKILEI